MKLDPQFRIQKRINRIWNYLHFEKKNVDGLTVEVKKIRTYLVDYDGEVCYDEEKTRWIKLIITKREPGVFCCVDEILKMFSEPVEDENTVKTYSRVDAKTIAYETSVTKNANVKLYIVTN